jgi:hypothetical protein
MPSLKTEWFELLFSKLLSLARQGSSIKVANMKRLFAVGLLTLLCITAALTASAEETVENPLADAPTQYSANLVVTRKGWMPLHIRLYVDGNKRRTEQGANGENIVILRGDQSKRYMLNARTKTYWEGPLDPKMVEASFEWAKAMGIVHEKVGTEDVNGELCDKYHYTTDPAKMQKGQSPATTQRFPRLVSGYIWVGQTTHMLLKSENPASTAEWKDVKLGPPDSSVFEIPAEYKKVENNGLPVAKPSVDKSDGEKSDDLC